MSSNNYLQWLHDVTLLGYDNKVIIPASFKGEVKAMYERELTPVQAWEEIQTVLQNKPAEYWKIMDEESKD